MKITFSHNSSFANEIKQQAQPLLDKLLKGDFIRIKLEPGGYTAKCTVTIPSQLSEFFETHWTGTDVTRFPARIKAVAACLRDSNLHGRFFISHNNGDVTIRKILHVQELVKGQVFDNTYLCTVFGCGTQGGMRRSKSTNSLVLISNHLESIYEDRWENGILHYTGMGMTGDQSLNFLQNKTLSESNNNGISIHLFEVFQKQKYLYQGQVQLCEEPYKEFQLDQEGMARQVWIFPLSLKEGIPITPDQEVLTKNLTNKLSTDLKKISIENLKKQVENKSKPVVKKQSIRVEYTRDPWVVDYALRRAKGICQLCNKPAPFKSKTGLPFLEVHHINYLSQGGTDSYDNVVALCPNCHRRMHMLENKKEVQLLLDKAKILL